MNPDALNALFGAGLASLGPDRREEAWALTDAVERMGEVRAGLALSEGRAACLEALVLLWHDHLDEAHGRVQNLGGADAAFVHGIMHRREPDYSNARYWFHRVGAHPTGESLADAAAPVLAAHTALPHRLIRDGRWDGFAFIDAVAMASRQPADASEPALLRQLQRIEALVLARHLAGL